MKMRWVPVWEEDPEAADGRKAKAHIVILGYQDPDLEAQQPAPPTLTRTTRQLILHMATWLQMKSEKGDVKEAF